MKAYLAIPLCLLFGCSTLTPEKVNNLAVLAGTAASIGAQLYLQAHPEQKPAFDLAIVALNAFLASGGANPSQFANLLSSLPTNTLPGPTADLYVSGQPLPDTDHKRLIIYKKGEGVPVVVQGKDALPVARAITAGLQRAVLAKPPAGRAAKRIDVR